MGTMSLMPCVPGMPHKLSTVHSSSLAPLLAAHLVLQPVPVGVVDVHKRPLHLF
jgi:hypothetical protein